MVAPPNYTSLIVELSRNALVAASLSEALSPMLDALVTRTGADAAVYIQSSGEVFIEKASAGNVPDAISFLSIATNGIHASDPLIQAVGDSCEPLVERDLSEPASCGSLFSPFGIRSIVAVRVTGRLEEFLGVVRFHHEKWDGSGYPDGLRGDSIPLGGRIFAVADVFDALMSARPYKKAWSLGEAREEILKHAGTHFDREVVQAFLQSGHARSRDGARSA